MSQAGEAYLASRRRLEQHLRDCALCGSGLACDQGDQAADGEYRAWRAWQQAEPDQARTAQHEGYTW